MRQILWALCVAPMWAACGPDLPDPTPADPWPDGSLYAMNADLVDQTGSAVGLDAWAGHPTVVSMVYTTCPTACPALIRDIKDLEAGLSPSARAELRVLLVSLDPEKDGPKQLNALAVAHGMDTERWKLVRAEPLRTRDIAQALDVEFEKRADGEMDHTSLLALYDEEGIRIARLYGLGKDTKDFRARIEALAQRR